MCEKPGWCEELKMVLDGRLWEIYQGVNIEASKRIAYLEQWRMKAQRIAPVKPKGCNCGKKK